MESKKSKEKQQEKWLWREIKIILYIAAAKSASSNNIPGPYSS